MLNGNHYYRYYKYYQAGLKIIWYLLPHSCKRESLRQMLPKLPKHSGDNEIGNIHETLPSLSSIILKWSRSSWKISTARSLSREPFSFWSLTGAAFRIALQWSIINYSNFDSGGSGLLWYLDVRRLSVIWYPLSQTHGPRLICIIYNAVKD